MAANEEAVEVNGEGDEELQLTPAQEQALLAHDANMQVKIRKLLLLRQKKIKQLDEMDLGDDDDEEKVYKRFDMLRQHISDMNAVLKRKNIPIDDDEDEDPEQRIVADLTPIPALNEWLHDFMSREPQRNIAHGVHIVEYERPKIEDIVKQLTAVEENAKTDNKQDVLDLLKDHVGDDKERYAIKVHHEISKNNKLQQERRVERLQARFSTHYRMPLIPVDEPTSSLLSQSRANEQPKAYMEASEEIMAAIERGDVDLGEDDSGDDVDEEEGSEKATEEADEEVQIIDDVEKTINISRGEAADQSSDAQEGSEKGVEEADEETHGEDHEELGSTILVEDSESRKRKDSEEAAEDQSEAKKEKTNGEIEESVPEDQAVQQEEKEQPRNVPAEIVTLDDDDDEENSEKGVEEADEETHAEDREELGSTTFVEESGSRKRKFSEEAAEEQSEPKKEKTTGEIAESAPEDQAVQQEEKEQPRNVPAEIITLDDDDDDDVVCLS